jgi:hypothetical protein
MKPDPIVQEVREARAAIAEAFGYDRTAHIAYAPEQTRLRNEARARGEAPRPSSPSPSFSSNTPPNSVRRIKPPLR